MSKWTLGVERSVWKCPISNLSRAFNFTSCLHSVTTLWPAPQLFSGERLCYGEFGLTEGWGAAGEQASPEAALSSLPSVMVRETKQDVASQ